MHKTKKTAKFRRFRADFGARLALAGALVAPLLLAACMPPATQDVVRQNWQEVHDGWLATDWGSLPGKLTGLDLSRPFRPAEAEGDHDLCLNPNGEDRVLSENGRSDYVVYHHCPVSPYPSANGERLSPGHVDPVELNHPLND